MSLVGSVLDLPACPGPILLQRIETLHHRLELEAGSGTLEARLAQLLDAALDVFVLYSRLPLLKSHEVLFVQDAQAFESVFQLSDFLICFLFLCHEIRLRRALTLALVVRKIR